MSNQPIPMVELPYPTRETLYSFLTDNDLDLSLRVSAGCNRADQLELAVVCDRAMIRATFHNDPTGRRVERIREFACGVLSPYLDEEFHRLAAEACLAEARDFAWDTGGQWAHRRETEYQLGDFVAVVGRRGIYSRDYEG